MIRRVILARHARHAGFGERLLGRTPGVGLDDAGRAQAAAMAERLRRFAPVALATSPTQRARETAETIGRVLGLVARDDPAFDEIDMGEWSGKRFDQLAADPRWRFWNEQRDRARAPRGETMAEAGTRARRAAEELAARAPGRAVVIVSHADVIKAVLLAERGLPMQDYRRLEIGPAELHVLPLRADGRRALPEAV